MPAALAPFVLRITEVKAERLGEISDADAIDEGMMHWARTDPSPFPEAECVRPSWWFGTYWDQLYGAGSWNDDAQKWVWAYKFEIAESRIG